MPCNFCKGEEITKRYERNKWELGLYEWDDEYYLEIRFRDSEFVEWDCRFRINYCPICGKRLGGVNQ